MIAIDPEEVFDYVLKAERDKPEEEQSVFELGVLTSRQEAKLQDQAFSMSGATMVATTPSGTMNLQTLRAALRNWRKVRARDGSEVPFECEGKRLDVLGEQLDPPSYKTLDRIHPDDRAELAQAIRNANRVTDDEAKN